MQRTTVITTGITTGTTTGFTTVCEEAGARSAAARWRLLSLLSQLSLISLLSQLSQLSHRKRGRDGPRERCMSSDRAVTCAREA